MDVQFLISDDCAHFFFAMKQDLRYRMIQRGVNAISLQPQWCALRPDACDLTA